MLKILIVNQPGYNRGDESAHKALVRTLLKRIPDAQIRVISSVYFGESVRQFAVVDKRASYIEEPTAMLKYQLFKKLGMEKGWKCLWNIHPTFMKYKKLFKWADVVLCAPGGICMGGFQDWNHIFNLELAQFSHKPIAYYGRSFGPFPTETVRNRKFKEISLRLLHSFKFLAIRDKKTEKLADELHIPYVSTVDTAFLDSPAVEIPYELQHMIGKKPYMVFVPNYLLWHYAYAGRISHETVIQFYSQVIDEIWKANPELNIVMLPQVFGGHDYAHSDVEMFREIAHLKQDDRLIVTPDCYSSDVQQTIIHDAKYVIGGRYHSIVFAINQGVPCIALSYEHKISGLLEALGKSEWCIEFSKVFDSEENRQTCLNEIKRIIPTLRPDEEARQKAKEIANRCMNQFVDTFVNGKN